MAMMVTEAEFLGKSQDWVDGFHEGQGRCDCDARAALLAYANLLKCVASGRDLNFSGTVYAKRSECVMTERFMPDLTDMLLLECSECNVLTASAGIAPRFCPFCGAEVMGTEEDE